MFHSCPGPHAAPAPCAHAHTPAPSSAHIYVVDAPCGGGKSYAAIQTVADGMLRHDRYLVCGPTIEQVKQFACDLRHELLARWRSAPPPQRWAIAQTSLRVTDIHAESVQWEREPGDQPSIRQALIEAINSTQDGQGRALLITHAALMRIAARDLPDGWHLIVDESPEALTATDLTLTHAAAAALRFRHDRMGRLRLVDAEVHLRALETAARRERLVAENYAARAHGAEGERRAREIARVRRNLEEPLRVLKERAASGRWRIAARPSVLEAEDSIDPPRHLRPKLSGKGSVSLVLIAELAWNKLVGKHGPRWASCTFMSANFRQSFAGLTLARQGFHLIPHPVITLRLRYQQHPIGDRLRVLYATAAKASKHRRDRDVDGRTFGAHVIEAVEREFAGKPFAWTANLDVPDAALSGTRMPFVSHGLNRYIGYSNIAVLSIARLNPQCEAALVEDGFAPDQIEAAVLHEVVYQSACRGGARNPNGTEALTVVVPDQGCANFLAVRFQGCVVAPMGLSQPVEGKPGRPRTYADDRERERLKKSRQRARQQVDTWRRDLLADVRGTPDFTTAIYDHKRAPTPSEVLLCRTWDDVRAVLAASADDPPVRSKEHNKLVLQAVLKTFRDDECLVPMSMSACGRVTHRAVANVVSRSTLWFDVESMDAGASGAPISPGEFSTLIAGTAMVLYRSFSHEPTPEGTRYRVVIPLTCAVGPDAYQALHDLIRDRIEQAGWLRWERDKARLGRFHGLDPAARSATLLLYLPRRRTGTEVGDLIEHVDGAPLDVSAWLGGDLSRVVKEIREPETDTVRTDQGDTDEALSAPDVLLRAAQVLAVEDDYASAPRGTQNARFNRLGWQMAGLRVPRPEIEARLLAAARASHSPADRVAQVARVMAGLPSAE